MDIQLHFLVYCSVLLPPFQMWMMVGEMVTLNQLLVEKPVVAFEDDGEGSD
jgi:hypothetical protein